MNAYTRPSATFQILVLRPTGCYEVIGEHTVHGAALDHAVSYVKAHNCAHVKVIHSETQEEVAEFFDVRNAMPERHVSLGHKPSATVPRQWRYQPAQQEDNGTTRYLIVDVKLNLILPDWWRSQADRDAALDRDNAYEAIDKAVQILGLDGVASSLTDLLADNFPMWPLEKCRQLGTDWKATKGDQAHHG